MQSYEHGASPSGYPLKPILQQKGPNGEGQCDHPGWNTYALLLLALENPTPAADRRTQIIEALGNIAGIWPASCLIDQLENAA